RLPVFGSLMGAVSTAVTGGSSVRRSPTAGRAALPFGPRRLGGIRAQQAILQRGAVEPADDGVHLLRVGRFDKREALGLLRFGIADDLNCVRDQVFGCQPSLDIVRSDPGGQVAQKDGKTHSVIVSVSVRGGIASLKVVREGTIMLPQRIKPAGTVRMQPCVCGSGCAIILRPANTASAAVRHRERGTAMARGRRSIGSPIPVRRYRSSG